MALTMKKIYACFIALLMTFAVASVNAADLTLGPGDVLKISVFGNPDLSLETRVSEAGSITFPLIGEVNVGGLATAAAERKISKLLTGGGFLRKAEVNIIVTLLQSQQVSVLGQVLKPGRFPVDGKRTVVDMVAVAGGVSTDGGDVVSLLRTRNGTTTKETLDLQEMVRTSDMQKNFEVVNGDVIYVERAPRFFIYGEVQRAGAYRLEQNMTVIQALSLGGGLSLRGTERGVRIKRRDANGKLQTIKAEHDDLIQPNDVVYVRESLF